MSLSSIKAKQAKGKQKTLPKLKTILANPYKSKCPTLDEDEVQHLKNVFREAITSSGMDPRAFGTSKRLRLGLESSMRAINNCQCSCVFLSLSIKPRHIVRLIARSMEVKDKTVPVYVQPQLEKFTKDLFGIGALALVLPTVDELKKLKLEDIANWVDHKKLKKNPTIDVKEKQNTIKRNKKVEIKLQEGQTNKEANVTITPNVIKQKTPFSGDFISFSSIEDQMELEDDKDRLLDALSKMTKKAKKSHATENIEQMDIVKVQSSINLSPTPANDTLINLDSDDFLEDCQYQPLVVHKINPNPDKQKKKRKKNKNKKKL